MTTPARPGRSRRVGTRLLALGILASLALSACADKAPQTTLEPKGPAAEKIDGLWNLTFGIAAFVFVVVELGVLFIAFKFKARKGDDSLPKQLHGNTRAEIGWTVLPAVILAFLGVATVGTILDLADKPEGALEVRVVGQQWWWSFDYDIDGDGVYADSDVVNAGVEHPEEYATDIETAGDLVIPVGRPVLLDIQARDVIHSFWIPALNGKKDAVPGRSHPLTLEADAPGTYVGQCTEYCGLSHAYMRMKVVALPEAEFEAWLEGQADEAESPTDAAAQRGAELFATLCASCHLIEGVNDEGYAGAAQVSGAAPNLTHFASRTSYAGHAFDLWVDQDGDDIAEFDEVGQDLNRADLEAWLRDPPKAKPLAPNDNRGMPNLGLTEENIDDLVAYLLTLD